jgi:hypothetical protein
VRHPLAAQSVGTMERWSFVSPFAPPYENATNGVEFFSDFVKFARISKQLLQV